MEIKGGLHKVRDSIQELRYFADPALPTDHLGNLITMVERADKALAIIDAILEANDKAWSMREASDLMGTITREEQDGRD